MLLAGDLKDKKGEVRAREEKTAERERESIQEEPQHADQMLQICQSKQLSFHQAPHRTIRWLIIDKLSLCCFLAPSLPLSVSASLPSPHFFFPSQRLDTGSDMKAADLCLGLSQVILLPVPRPLLLTGYPLSLSPPISLGPCLSFLSSHPLLLWHLPGRRRDPHISTHPPAQPRCRFYPTQLRVREKQE